MTDTKRTPRIPPGVLFREVHGEAVLLHLDSGEYFGLDEVATRIWQLIASGSALDSVEHALVDEFDVDRGTAARDIQQFVSTLVDRRLLTFDSDADS
jgi:hypothetical protein